MTNLKSMDGIEEYFQSRLQADPRRTVLWKTLWTHYFSRLIHEEDTVLDLGSGYCDFINQVKARRRFAVDQWPGITQHASPDIQTHVGPLTDLDWLPDGSVDFAFASNVFEHIPQVDLCRILGQLKRKLTRRGKLCLVQPNYRYCSKEYFDDYTHVTVFSHISLQEFLASNGFKTLDCQPRFLPLTIKSRFPVHPLLIRAYLASPLKPQGKQMLVLAEPNER